MPVEHKTDGSECFCNPKQERYRTEHDTAVALANRRLEDARVDPDSDFSTVCRQFLRLVESEKERVEQPFPAIITHVWSNDYVNLRVLPDGSFPLAAVISMATMQTMPTKVMRGKKLGQWDWPK